jgi:transposase-like protein
MYLSGMSYKQIAELIGRNFNLPEPSKETIYRWVQEYGDFAVEGLNGQVPQTSGHWVADEMQLKVGGQRMWNWNVMDRDTRYLLASHLSPYRDEREAIAVFEKAIKANGGVIPETITTDQLGSYEAAIGLMLPGVKHIKSDGIHEEVNNNLSERVQKTFRSRTKTMDGLFGQETGQKYLDRWVVDYNHFKDHEALDGRTPADAAQVEVKLDEWTDIVREADKFKAAENVVKHGRKQKSPPDPVPSKPTLGETLGFITPERRQAQIEQAVEEFRRRQVPPPNRTNPQPYTGQGTPGGKTRGRRGGRGGLRL